MCSNSEFRKYKALSVSFMYRILFQRSKSFSQSKQGWYSFNLIWKTSLHPLFWVHFFTRNNAICEKNQHTNTKCSYQDISHQSFNCKSHIIFIVYLFPCCTHHILFESTVFHTIWLFVGIRLFLIVSFSILFAHIFGSRRYLGGRSTRQYSICIKINTYSPNIRLFLYNFTFYSHTPIKYVKTMQFVKITVLYL